MNFKLIRLPSLQNVIGVDTESYMDDLSEKLVENMKMNVNMLQLQDATSKIR